MDVDADEPTGVSRGGWLTSSAGWFAYGGGLVSIVQLALLV